MSDAMKELKALLLDYTKTCIPDGAEGYDFILAHFEDALAFVQRRASLEASAQHLEAEVRAQAERDAAAADCGFRNGLRGTYEDHFQFRSRMHKAGSDLRAQKALADFNAAVQKMADAKLTVLPVTNDDTWREQVLSQLASAQLASVYEDPELQAAEAAVLARLEAASEEDRSAALAQEVADQLEYQAGTLRREQEARDAANKKARLIAALVNADKVYVRNNLPGILPLTFKDTDGTHRVVIVPRTKRPVYLDSKTVQHSRALCVAVGNEHLTLLDPVEAAAELAAASV